MGRKKKIDEKPPATTYICKFCGEDVEIGHPCKCKEGRKEFAKQLYEKHYGRRKRTESE